MREDADKRLRCVAHHVLCRAGVSAGLILALSLSPQHARRLTCCSRVMTVCTRKLPLSQGSVIPTEPGRKSPAARIWRQRLQDKAPDGFRQQDLIWGAQEGVQAKRRLTCRRC